MDEKKGADKKELRERMIEKREFHHSKGGHVHCIRIMDCFLHLPEFDSAKCMLVYASKGAEVHTDGIIQSALSLGKKVCLPATIKETHSLELYSIGDMKELELGEFGILEPQKKEERKVDPKEIDLAVVPGVSFDRRGHRIGYGRGYYDSLLSKIKGTKVGLSYGLQIMKRVPTESHDVAVDMIVTEQGVIDCSGDEAKKKITVVVLASGRGSDFQSIIEGIRSGKVAAHIIGFITDNASAKAIGRAKRNGIPSFVIEHKSREELDKGIKQKLDELEPDLVVLAGYMKIIKDKELLEAYKGKIINIHPSLLPKYPGAHAQKDAFDAGEKVSGYTIHFVDSSLDGGPIIHQEKVDISGCKDAEEAAAEILEREHIGLPMIVGKFAKGKFEIKDGKVEYKENL